MKLFVLILGAALASCSSQLEMPKNPKNYLENGCLMLDVISLENEVGFDEISAFKETHALVGKIFEWSKKKFKPIGISNQGKLTIDNADFTVTQTDHGLVVKTFADIKLEIYSAGKKKLVETKISGEKTFNTRATVSPIEKESLINILMNQLVFSINEEFEKNISDDLSRYVFMNHNEINPK